MYILYHNDSKYIKIRGTDNPRFIYKLRKDWKDNYTLTYIDMPDYNKTMDCLMKVEDGKIVNLGRISDLEENNNMPNLYEIFPPVFEDN